MEHAEELRQPYDALAALLNCSPDEIAVVQVHSSFSMRMLGPSHHLHWLFGLRHMTRIQADG